MVEFIQVITVVGDREEAESIAQKVVGKRLAGCVQVVGPITSTYWWKGKIEKAEEWLCLMKSQTNLYQELETEIARDHSYETPEILAVPITKGSRSYLDWLEGELEK